jgi:hypothetical protein
VRIPFASLLPEDVSINTFSFVTTAVDAPTFTAIATRLKAFYDAIQAPGTVSIVSRLADWTAPASANLRIYNRADAKPRAPRYDAPLVLSGDNGTGGFPAEVAICCSFAAANVSGEAAARRRGRVYIGPLSSVGNTDVDPVQGTRPNATLRNALAGAAKALATSSDAVASWVVHSDVLNSDATVIRGWVDNAFDTQRRRGESPTTRTSWTV